MPETTNTLSDALVGRLLGPYRIQAVLGRGGMSQPVRANVAQTVTAAGCAGVIDIGWNGNSRDGLDMEHLTRRPAARPGRARRRHGEALEHPDASLTRPLRQAANDALLAMRRLRALG